MQKLEKIKVTSKTVLKDLYSKQIKQSLVKDLVI